MENIKFLDYSLALFTRNDFFPWFFRMLHIFLELMQRSHLSSEYG